MLQITLSPQTEAVLRERAQAAGEDVATYAARLLQQAISTPDVEALLAPFRMQVEASGATDDELDALCEELRDEAWSERQARKAKRA